jgi:hypothetical protein
MKCVVKNKSSMDMGPLLPLLKSLLPYTRKKLGFNRPPSLFFASDAENASKPLGKTAFYDPAEVSITVFVDGRHPKDILRSISHELVHHMQHERGDFGTDMDTGEGYAQKNDALRELEREAYESGNMCFRDWEDENRQALQEAKQHFDRKNKKMSAQDKRSDNIESLLMEKWGLKNKTEEKNNKKAVAVKIVKKSGASEDIIRNIIKETFSRSKRGVSVISERPRKYSPEETRAEYSSLLDAEGARFNPDFDFTGDAEPFGEGLGLSEKIDIMAERIRVGRLEGGEGTPGGNQEWLILLEEYANSGDPLKREIAIRSLNYDKMLNTYQTKNTSSEGFNLEWMMRAKYKDKNGEEKYIFSDAADFLSLESGDETEKLQTLLTNLNLNTNNDAKRSAEDAMSRYNLTNAGASVRLPNDSSEYKEWLSGAGWWWSDGGLGGAIEALEKGDYDGKEWEQLTEPQKREKKEETINNYMQENPPPTKERVRTTGANVYEFEDIGLFQNPFSGGPSDAEIQMRKLLNQRYDQMAEENPAFAENVPKKAFYSYYNDFVEEEFDGEAVFGQSLARMVTDGDIESRLRTQDPVNTEKVHRYKTDSTGFGSLLANPETREIFMPPDTTRASSEWLEGKKQEFLGLETGEEINTFISGTRTEREAPDFDANLTNINNNYAIDAAVNAANAASSKMSDVEVPAADEIEAPIQDALIRKVVQEALKRKFGE